MSQKEPWSAQKEVECGRYRRRSFADMLMAGADMASIVNTPLHTPLAASNPVEAMLQLFDGNEHSIARAPGTALWR